MLGLILKSDRFKWSFLFSLWIFHGIIALCQYLPSIDSIILFLASSTSRLAVFLALVFWLILNTALVIFMFKGRLEWISWKICFERSKVRDGIVVLSLLILFVATCVWTLFGLSSITPDSQIDNYIRIVLPLLQLATFWSFEIIALVLIVEIKNQEEVLRLNLKWIIKFLVVLTLLGTIAAFIFSTGLGIVPSYDKGDWSRGIPSVPLFEWCIFLAAAFSVVAALLEFNVKFFNYMYMDQTVALVIWVLTLFIWLGQPIVPNASALGPWPPNFEVYPFTDAQTYDQYAQSVLVGNGFGESIPPRSLYIAFLTIGHVLVGQDFEAMILFQSIFFSFFPVLLYLLGRQLFGRPIGVAVALLAIFRDFTSNLVSPFTGNLSYSKIFMSEIPTAMLLVLFMLLALYWIRKGFPLFVGFLMGGVLGLAMLIRTQASVALPVVVVFGFLAMPRKIKSLIGSVLVIILAVILTASPWLWRNWLLTGRVIFDSPEFQMSNIALRYGRLNDVDNNIVQFSGESLSEYNARLSTMAKNAILANPQRAVWGVVNTFLNHGVNNILLFPLRYELVSLKEFWMPENAFWEWWDGKPNSVQSILLFFYVFIFGLGVSVAWHRNGVLGLLPLGLNLAYNLWTSLALLSGQRFMVAMDWSVYIYYMIGVFSLIVGFSMMLTQGRLIVSTWVRKNPFITTLESGDDSLIPLRRYLLVGAMFLFLGALPPLVEKGFPARYPNLSETEVLAKLLESPALLNADVSPACMHKLAQENSITVTLGRALYPRFYEAGEGEKITDASGYKAVDESRLVFELVGQGYGRVVFPLLDYPAIFPHASDVMLIYGQNETPWFVLVEKDGKEAFYISSFFDHSLCE